MIKKLIITSVIFLTAAIAAKSAITEPEWTEFCPSKYCDSNRNIFSKDSTYWYKRRTRFEKAMKKCSSETEEELENCYNKIRETQTRKNNKWEKKQKKKYKKTKNIREQEKKRMSFYKVKRNPLNNLKDTDSTQPLDSE